MDGEVVPMRTDADRVGKVALRLLLGGQVKEVRPLVLRKSKEWKRTFAGVIGDAIGLTFDAEKAGSTASPQALKDMVEAVALNVPDKLQDLVFAYLRLADPTLDLDALEDLVTDQEITDALWAMIQVTFPFFWKAGDLVKLAGSFSR